MLRRRASFFDRALAADPDNVDALVGSAAADAHRGRAFLCDRSHGGLRGGRSEVDQSLVLGPGPCACAHLCLGLVDIWTKRAAQGIAECEQALELDRNLASAHSLIGYGKLFVGRAEETETHIAEALRLSPRDTMAYIWMFYAGMAKLVPRQLRAGGRVVSAVDRGQPKFSDIAFLLGRRPRAAWST